MAVVDGAAASLPELGSEDLEEHAEELEEQLTRWVACQTVTWCTQLVPSAGRRPPLVRSPAFRSEVVRQLQGLLELHGALDELTTALTLWDAVAEKVGLGLPSAPLEADELEEGTTLAAVVRLVLKCTVRMFPEKFWTLKTVEQRLVAGWSDGENEVAQKEWAIVRLMDGRVALPSLPSPIHWATAVFQRASVLVALDRNGAQGWSTWADAAADLIRSAFQKVGLWAEFLAVRVCMVEEMPPRSLALAACVLSLVSIGALPVEEVQPADVDPFIWQTSILVQHRALEDQQQGQDAAQRPAQLPAQLLARAACCTVPELADVTFSVVLALQAVLFQGG